MIMEVKVEKMGKFDKWKVEDAARTLQEAEEIKKDTALMSEVKKILKKKIKSLDDLRDLLKEKESED